MRRMTESIDMQNEAATAEPLLSVIVPTRHRNDHLAVCLDRLAPGVQTLPAARYEVIVTDDGAEATAEAMVQARYAWARWVAGPRRGPAANRNNGARKARGAWFVFADDDILPDPTWLAAYADAIEAAPGCDVFEGRTYVDRPRRSFAEISPVNEQGGHLWSCNFAIRAACFNELGGFEERFPYPAYEDIDFLHRLQQQHADIRFLREASVLHPWRPHRAWKRHKQQLESLLIFLTLHPKEQTAHRPLTYLKSLVGRILRGTIPGLIRYRGRGLGEELVEYAATVRTAWHLRRFYRSDRAAS